MTTEQAAQPKRLATDTIYQVSGQSPIDMIGELRGFGWRVVQMALVDIKKEYYGAMFNALWAVARPLTYLLVYWFVLRFGLKANAMSGQDVDLFPWLTTGLVVWFFCADAINGGMQSIKKYSYLVTKMKFPVVAIPLFVVLSNLITHLSLLAICLVYFIIRGDSFDVTWVQLPIYTALMAIFFAFWAIFSAPLAIICKDFIQAVKSIVRILFWISGVIWSVRLTSLEWVQHLAMFNPISFFVEGYRDALLHHIWIWERPKHLICFLVILLLMMFMAIRVYKRTRKEIADLL